VYFLWVVWSSPISVVNIVELISSLPARARTSTPSRPTWLQSGSKSSRPGCAALFTSGPSSRRPSSPTATSDTKLKNGSPLIFATGGYESGKGHRLPPTLPANPINRNAPYWWALRAVTISVTDHRSPTRENYNFNCCKLFFLERKNVKRII